MNVVAIGKVAQIIGPTRHLLRNHSSQRRFRQEWERNGLKGVILSSVLCITVIVGNMIGIGQEPQMLPWLCTNSCTVVAFIMTTQCLCHILSFLQLLLNQFVDEFLHKQHWKSALVSWNVVLALLDHASQVTARCFVVLQIATTYILSTCLFQLASALTAFPEGSVSKLVIAFSRSDNFNGIMLSYANLLVILLSSARVFIKATAITKTCTGIPSVVNSFHLDDGGAINHDKQYLVQHIKNSDAGFYLNEIRLTPSLLVKAAYFAGAVSYSVVTTSLSRS